MDILEFFHVRFHDFFVVEALGLDNVEVLFLVGLFVILEARLTENQIFVFLVFICLVEVGELVLALGAVFKSLDDFLDFVIRGRDAALGDNELFHLVGMLLEIGTFFAFDEIVTFEALEPWFALFYSLDTGIAVVPDVASQALVDFLDFSEG